ncbi:glycosyltransferase family 2 protein [Allohahella marinimesophila]|uniref:Glycosyltransferase n=1 Tax=Allohahella marinimesophila TaxID=1054972 RepID=A0ABP7NLK4_9GAMM
MTQSIRQFPSRLRTQSWRSDASVLTYGKGRHEHLCNLVLGLESQTITPTELIIAYMADEPYSNLPQASFPIRQIHVSADTAALPLAAARNAAAQAAVSSHLVFLDIDCIPSPRLVEDYIAALSHWNGLLVGDVRYLRKGGNAPGWTPHTLMLASVVHAERRLPPKNGIERCTDYRVFSSMSFAARKTLFLEAGGFDERYDGYGAEDSDFSREMSELGIDIGWCAGATAFHQYHLQHRPPVHRLQTVLANNRVYRQKWGQNTMEHWLRAFERLGLIKPAGDDFEILRDVTDQDLLLTQQSPNDAYASTRAFLDRLDVTTSEENGTHSTASVLTASASPD